MDKIIDFITDNLLIFCFALFIGFITFNYVGEVLPSIILALITFVVFYLRQNAFNPFANKWVKIGGFIVLLIWILILTQRGK